MLLGLRVIKKASNAITLRGCYIDKISNNAEVSVKGSAFNFRAMLSITSLVSGMSIGCNDSLFTRESVLNEDFLNFFGLTVQRDNDTEKFFISEQTEQINYVSTKDSSQFLTFALMISSHFLLLNRIQQAVLLYWP